MIKVSRHERNQDAVQMCRGLRTFVSTPTFEFQWDSSTDWDMLPVLQIKKKGAFGVNNDDNNNNNNNNSNKKLAPVVRIQHSFGVSVGAIMRKHTKDMTLRECDVQCRFNGKLLQAEQDPHTIG